MKDLFYESLGDIWRHRGPVFQYLVLSMTALVLYRLLNCGLEVFNLSKTALTVASMAHLMLALYLAVTVSFFRTFCFSNLGAVVARPMWKYKGCRDALNRFYVSWLIIALFLVTLTDIQTRLVQREQNDLTVMIGLVLLAGHVAAVPLGAVIMYWGALNWRELTLTIAPLIRFAWLTLLPLGLGLIQYAMIAMRPQFLDEGAPGDLVFYTLTDIPIVLLDILIFLAIWHIGMLDQTTPRNADEDSFDF